MKLFAVAFVFFFSIAVSAGHRHPKPCPKPAPLPVAEKLDQKYNRGDHSAMAAAVSVIAFGGLQESGLGTQKAYMGAVALALATSAALEPDRRARDKALPAAAIGALVGPLLVFKF